jgi:hypothetical protein
MRGFRRGVALLGSGLIAAGTFTGCGETAPSRGGLMLLVSTDGPLAIDRLDIEIASTDHSLLANKYRVPEEVTLPTTVAIFSNGNATAQATISVTGWAGDVPLDRRDAIVTQIPNDRVATLNVVLSARCSNKLTVGGNGKAVSSCGEGNTCDNRGDCVTATVTASDLPTYRAGDEHDAGIGGTSAVGPSFGGSGGESGVFERDAAGAGGSAGQNGLADAGGAGGEGESGAGGEGGSGGVDAHVPDPYCGDGTKNGAEICDDGTNVGRYGGCMPGCMALGPHCGDRLTDQSAGEQCDDGGETRNCNANCALAFCGDGIINSARNEQCDDRVESSRCDADCTFAICGDQTINHSAKEDCDDGKETATCNTKCTSPHCGDGTVNKTLGESCDDGGETQACNVDCSFARCGDSKINSTAGEKCDDGKETATCNANCTNQRCGDTIINVTAGEQCDTGGNTATCVNCHFVSCGNGIAEPGEDCDTKGDSPTCNANCHLAKCGDGYVNTKFPVKILGSGATNVGEYCDNNTGTTSNPQIAVDDSAECDKDCTTARCGDAHINALAGEECDPTYVNAGNIPPETATCTNTCVKKP